MYTCVFFQTYKWRSLSLYSFSIWQNRFPCSSYQFLEFSWLLNKMYTFLLGRFTTWQGFCFVLFKGRFLSEHFHPFSGPPGRWAPNRGVGSMWRVFLMDFGTLAVHAAPSSHQLPVWEQRHLTLPCLCQHLAKWTGPVQAYRVIGRAKHKYPRRVFCPLLPETHVYHVWSSLSIYC